MDRKQLKLIVILVLTSLWLVSVYPFFNILLRISVLSFPIEIHLYQIMRLIILTGIFGISMLIFGILDLRENENLEPEHEQIPLDL